MCVCPACLHSKAIYPVFGLGGSLHSPSALVLLCALFTATKNILINTFLSQMKSLSGSSESQQAVLEN